MQGRADSCPISTYHTEAWVKHSVTLLVLELVSSLLGFVHHLVRYHLLILSFPHLWIQCLRWFLLPLSSDPLLFLVHIPLG
jgi:hypothetical protein